MFNLTSRPLSFCEGKQREKRNRNNNDSHNLISFQIIQQSRYWWHQKCCHFLLLNVWNQFFYNCLKLCLIIHVKELTGLVSGTEGIIFMYYDTFLKYVFYSWIKMSYYFCRLQIKRFWSLYWNQNSSGPTVMEKCFAYCCMVVFSLHISECEEQIECSDDERR